MRTNEEIQAEIDKLTTMKPNVRHYSAFNDDHHAAIDVQITVLEKRMDMGEVSDRYGDEEMNIWDAAQEAAEWMNGEGEIIPSEEWQSLVL